MKTLSELPPDQPGPQPQPPLRYGPVTAHCLRCERILAPGQHKWCSNLCRQRAYRRRKKSDVPPAVSPGTPITTHDIVYECPSCGERYLGIQRCVDCNLFCTRIGPGGPCPHCDAPVAWQDLFQPAR